MTFAIGCLVAFALAGCAAPESPETASSSAAAPSSATPVPTPSTFTVSEKATCTQLIGPKEDGPLIQYINEITSIDPSDKVAVAKLVTTREDIKNITTRANPEMKEILTALFSEDVNDFKAAGTELLTRCS